MKTIGIDVFGKDVLQATLDYLDNAKHHYATPDGITQCQEWIKSLVEEPANDDLTEALRTEYEKGRYDMREEMMKEAVEAKLWKFYVMITAFADIHV